MAEDNENEASREILPIDFDSVLDEIGHFGKFQKILYFSVCAPIIFTTSLALSVVFSAAVPKSRCLIPNCDDLAKPLYADAFEQGFANFSIPFDKKTEVFSSCDHYKFTNATPQCSKSDFDESNIQNCSTGHVYDREYYGSTIMSEFDLACGKEWAIPLVESMGFVGIMFAAMAFGLLADKYGRKNVLMLSLSITVISGIIETFSTNYWMYLVFQSLVSLGQAGVFQTGFILAIESVGKSKRVFCGIVIEYFFVAGEIALTLIAMAFKDFRWLSGLPVIVLSLVLFAWPFCPESVRWLINQGRNEEAEKVVYRMVKVNKIHDFDLDDHRARPNSAGATQDHDTPKGESLLDVLKSLPLAMRFFNSCFCWMSVTMVYYGLSLNATNLAGSPYTNFILVSLVEIPGYTLSYLTMERLGRRKSTAISLVFSGICCSASSVLSDFERKGPFLALTTATFLLGKLGVTWTFGNIYVYTSELFPTSARTACVGLCSTSGRIGAILSPYIALLGQRWPYMPLAIFGCSAFISGFLVHIFLPETLGRPLPETIAEAANFNRRSSNTANVQIDPEVDENTPLLS